MGAHLAEQTVVFLQACLLGAALGMVYDVFRILRIAFPARPGVVFFQDVFFWVICTLTTFFFVLSSLDGVVRVFLIAGELLGGVLYHFTLGEVVMRLAHAIIAGIKTLLQLLHRFLLRPVVRLIYFIALLLLRPWRFLGEQWKKTQRRIKFRLKVRRIVLYNHYTGRTGKQQLRVRRKKAVMCTDKEK